METKIKKIKVITLGCAKNIYDSENLLGALKNSNYKITTNPNENSEIVIINTCGFIDSAKEESINTILEYVELKNKKKIEKLYVIGCLSERYKDDLKKEIPEVDEYFGSKNIKDILKTLKINYTEDLLGEREITTLKNYAYLKISEGCDRVCSFCAIPLIKGKHESRTIESLVEETKKLVKKGVKEIILIAQDSTLYGLDIYGKRDLARLLTELCKIDDLEWIRLHYAFPSGFPEDILEVIKREPKICKYIDIPLQHISDNVLTSMKRGITKEKTNILLDKIREIPGIAIRTSLIVGYPNETEEDFNDLLKWVKEQKFDRLGVFTYSHEEGTFAYSLEDKLSLKEKQKRKDIIMEAQREISYQKNLEKVGKRFKVIIEEKDENFYYGRTMYDSPNVDNDVIIDAKMYNIPLGEFINVEVSSAGEYDIFAIPVV